MIQSRWMLCAAAGVIALCLLPGCSNQNPATSGSGSTPQNGAPAQQAQGPGGSAAADEAQFLPNASLTPGDSFPVTAKDVCTPGYAKRVRDVPSDEKRQAYDEYGITSHQPGEYEVDHLISLELGGSNSIKNLWPQSYRTQPWNAHVKDKLEDELHRQVCDGEMDLATAQHLIAGNWIEAYKQVFHTDQPTTAARARRGRAGLTAPAETPPAQSQTGQVWVNTRSGVYWRPGTEYYGKTKQGQYMSEQEAVQQGYRAAGGQ